MTNSRRVDAWANYIENLVSLKMLEVHTESLSGLGKLLESDHFHLLIYLH